MASAGNGEIFRVDSDGGGLTTVTTFTAGVYGLAFDSADKILYASNINTGTILRYAIDTGTIETIFDGLQEPLGITLSSDGDTPYWVERTGGRVKSGPSDGSHAPQILVEGETSATPLKVRDNVPSDSVLRRFIRLRVVHED